MKSAKSPRRPKRSKSAKRPMAKPKTTKSKPPPRPRPPRVRDTASPGIEVPDAPLGPLVIPEPERAQGILIELAQLNDRAVYLHTKYERVRDEAREAKLAWEAAVTSVQETLRLVMHPDQVPLPLFDAVEREADQTRMEEAATTAPLVAVEEEVEEEDTAEAVPF